MTHLDFLEQVEVFKDLDDEQLLAVQGCCEESEYKRDEKIFGVKGKPLFLWAVMEGEVTLLQEIPGKPQAGEDPIASLSPGMTFGWSSLVPSSEYTLSAICTSRRCRLLKVDRNCLKKLFDDDLKLGYLVMSRIVAVVGSRFHQLREEIIKNRGQDIINRW
jgi:CRP-like cAMP-binding protein